MIRLIVRILIYILVFGGGFVFGYGTHSILSLVGPGLQEEVSEATVTADNTGSADTSLGTKVSATSSTADPKVVEKPIVVPLSSLSESQKAMLEKVGVTGSTLTITPKMAECAYATLGKERMDELVKGATPSAIEAIRLSPCLK